jgi:hypothetical protein
MMQQSSQARPALGNRIIRATFDLVRYRSTVWARKTGMDANLEVSIVWLLKTRVTVPYLVFSGNETDVIQMPKNAFPTVSYSF